MTISSTVRKVGPYTGNGSTTIFPFSFKVFTAADLLVIKSEIATGVETTLVLTTHYSVSLNADQNIAPGGSITLLTALPATHTMIISSTLSYLQATDLTNQGGFYPSVINAALDRLTIFIQQVWERTNRTISYPISDDTGNATLPSKTARSGKTLAFDTITGDPIAGPSISDVGTITTNIANVNTVATYIANVNTDAASISDINTVAGNIGSVTTTSTNIANVNTVGTYIANVNTVAGSIGNVNLVAVNIGTIADKVSKTASTGSAVLPTGTTAQEVTGQDGYIRFDSTLQVIRAWYGGAWNTIATTASTVLTTGAQTIAGIKTWTDGIIIGSGSKINTLGTSGALQIAGVDAVLYNTGGVTSKVQSLTATVASSALTITLNPCVLDFRSSTLGSGVPVTRTSNSAISVVVPSTATLGTVNAVQSRLVVLAIDNAGTVELAVTNISGGSPLDETGLISTTLIAAASNSATLYYSTTARTSVAYRVVGYVESTQATAGTWATAPSTVQGAGGNALTAMSSLGYGQTWQNVTGSRSAGTTYYNNTGRPIIFGASTVGNVSATQTLTVNGVAVATNPLSASMIPPYMSAVVPPNGSYSLTLTGTTLAVWTELR